MSILNRKRLVDTYSSVGLQDLNYIQLSNRSLNEIDPETFKGLTKLEKIEIDQNSFKFIRLEFTGLVLLKELNLSGNCLRDINLKAFDGLTRLEKLYLGCNQIKEIQPNLFNGLINLKVIGLGYNAITDIHPDTFKGLSKLNEVLLHANQLEKIDPTTFAGLKYLTKIEMWNNKFKTETIELQLEDSVEFVCFKLTDRCIRNNLNQVIKKVFCLFTLIYIRINTYSILEKRAYSFTASSSNKSK
jgi:Leucine-rich repeat (LRR) protein